MHHNQTNIIAQKSPKQQTSTIINDLQIFSLDNILNQSLPLVKQMFELADDANTKKILAAVLGKKNQIVFYKNNLDKANQGKDTNLKFIDQESVITQEATIKIESSIGSNDFDLKYEESKTNSEANLMATLLSKKFFLN